MQTVASRSSRLQAKQQVGGAKVLRASCSQTMQSQAKACRTAQGRSKSVVVRAQSQAGTPCHGVVRLSSPPKTLPCNRATRSRSRPQAAPWCGVRGIGLGLHPSAGHCCKRCDLDNACLMLRPRGSMLIGRSSKTRCSAQGIQSV